MPLPDPIYLDNNATAPLRAEVVAAIHQAMGPPANPSSVHEFGRRARLLVENARQSLSLLIGCRAQDVVFTSGGTESNNLALSGFSHVITSAIEHDSVLRAAPQASLLPVTDDGLVDLAAFKQMVSLLPVDQRDQTIVSVMAANNETGVIQPLEGIVDVARDAGLATHSDMVQMLGKTHIDLPALGLDFASFSAHKIGGPTGVGALFVRPGMRLTSLLRGGGQEQGRRSGTENILGITGFGAAATAAFGDVAHFRDMAGWRDTFEAEVAAAHPDVALFGAAAPRLGNISCLAVGGKSSETLVMALDIAGVAVSAGSACSSGKVTASHVLTAMGAGEKAAQAIRVSGGWKTRKEDFERLAQVLARL